ncbi:MAG: DUF2007 domain-containing protein [Planctomycetota bacterium]
MSDQLVIIAALADGLTAHSMRLLLEASGIQAFVTGDFPSEHGADEVHVMVREQDRELAQQIVSEVPQASEVLIPEWVCECGATVDAGFHLCWSCGAEHS